MVDSVLVFPPGFRVLDADGAPVSGAKIKFHETGPGDARVVYGDKDLTGPSALGSIVYTRSDGFPVVSSGSNTTTLIYTGSDPYWIEITDANDVPIFPAKDDVRGALDTSDFLTSADSNSLSIPVVSVTGDTTLDANYNGKLINANATGGVFTLTLDQATTLGNNWNCEIRNSGTANQVRISSTQNIAMPWGSRNAFSLRLGEAIQLRCDGATFSVAGYVPPLMSATTGIIEIADRVAAAPGGTPTPGARYIVTSGFTAGGVTAAVGDIIEATGQGTYIKITPPTNCGWLAYVQDEAELYQWQSSAWAQLLTNAASQSAQETATSLLKAVAPGNQHWHPSAAKCWCEANITGNIGASYNITSITDVATGRISYTIATDFSGSSWTALCSIDGVAQVVVFYNRQAGAINAEVFLVATGSDSDPTFHNFAGFGDQ